MKLALCNEVLREIPFTAQCAYAAALGYEAVEVAPFTLAGWPEALDSSKIAVLRREAEAAGIHISGLHWLLVSPSGLTLNGPDAAARARTVGVLRRLIDLCSALGGRYLVHGSPAQRSVAADDDPGQARARAVATLQAVAGDVEAAGLTYCIEPLGRGETNFINTIADAAALARDVGSAAFTAMLDTKAAAQTESSSISTLIAEWVPLGGIGHVQFNDPNRRGPGQGDLEFADIIAALGAAGYDGYVAMEPFDYFPDGAGAAAHAAGYVRGLLAGLDYRSTSNAT